VHDDLEQLDTIEHVIDVQHLSQFDTL